MGDQIADVRENLFVLGPRRDLMADGLMPGVGESRAQELDGCVKGFGQAFAALPLHDGCLQEPMEGQRAVILPVTQCLPEKGSYESVNNVGLHGGVG